MVLKRFLRINDGVNHIIHEFTFKSLPESLEFFLVLLYQVDVLDYFFLIYLIGVKLMDPAT